MMLKDTGRIVTVALLSGLLCVRGSGCPPSGWVQEGSSCYLFQTTSYKTWDEARSVCKQRGGKEADLVSITSDEENQFVYSKMRGKQLEFWIGMKKNGAGDPYLWADGSDVNYQNWDLAQPSDSNGNMMNCVSMFDSTGKWWDNFCTFPMYYVCKVPRGNVTKPSKTKPQ